MRLLFVIFCLISTGLKLGKIYLNRKQHQMDLPDYLKTLYDEKAPENFFLNFLAYY